MSKPGHQGGALARVVDVENQKSQRITEANNKTEAGISSSQLEEVEKRVSEHIEGIATWLRTAKRRRAVPQWTLPAELWLCMFRPKWRLPRAKLGLGQPPEQWIVKSFYVFIKDVVRKVVVSELAPQMWNTSMSIEIEKPTGGWRLINL